MMYDDDDDDDVKDCCHLPYLPEQDLKDQNLALLY